MSQFRLQEPLLYVALLSSPPDTSPIFAKASTGTPISSTRSSATPREQQILAIYQIKYAFFERPAIGAGEVEIDPTKTKTKPERNGTSREALPLDTKPNLSKK